MDRFDSFAIVIEFFATYRSDIGFDEPCKKYLTHKPMKEKCLSRSMLDFQRFFDTVEVRCLSYFYLIYF